MAVIDYTPFDIPEISMMAFYPQRVWAPPPDGAEDVMVPAAPGVDLSARFYKHDASAPTILFFHGNGEVAYMYDDIAPHYHRAGANFFAVDFRGYGRSGGSPSFSTMIGDANASFEFAKGLPRGGGLYRPPIREGPLTGDARRHRGGGPPRRRAPRPDHRERLGSDGPNGGPLRTRPRNACD